MRNITLTLTSAICMFLLNSCSIVGGIFKAGMGFGIFIVVAIVIAIVVFISRSGRNK